MAQIVHGAYHDLRQVSKSCDGPQSVVMTYATAGADCFERSEITIELAKERGSADKIEKSRAQAELLIWLQDLVALPVLVHESLGEDPLGDPVSPFGHGQFTWLSRTDAACSAAATGARPAQRHKPAPGGEF
jgi:hypothetical protein